jgi:hypothetical protein
MLDSAMFDVAIELKHSSHAGRGEQFGVSMQIGQWIRNNPNATVTIQREDLQRALKNGEIEELNDTIRYSPTLTHYRRIYHKILYFDYDFCASCLFLPRRDRQDSKFYKLSCSKHCVS